MSNKYTNALSQKEQVLQQNAVAFIKGHKKTLHDTFASAQTYSSRKNPITIFMAGTPGAGKTETSQRTIEKFGIKPVRIDADEIRELFRDQGYTGKNSYIFQQACSHGVDKLFDHVQTKRYHAVIDGTFAHEKAVDNVRRGLGRERSVFIYFIYQDPVLAWEVVREREKKEGRNIPREDFIESYFQSRKNVNEVKRVFGDQVELNLIMKDARYNLRKQRNNIDVIDSYLPKIYTRDELESMIT